MLAHISLVRAVLCVSFIGFVGACATGETPRSEHSLQKESDLDRELIEAVRNAHPIMVDELLRRGADPNGADGQTHKPLYYAVVRGDDHSPERNQRRILVLSRLLKAGAAYDSTVYNGENSLYWAAVFGNPDAIEILLSHGANPNLVGASRDGPMHVLVTAGNVNPDWIPERVIPAVETLLSFGADPNLTGMDGNTPLGLFVLHYSFDDVLPLSILESFLNFGADPNLFPQERYCPLARAASYGKTSLVQILLANGAEPDQLSGYYRETALMAAIYEDHFNAARLLLEAGAQPETRSDQYPHYTSVHLVSSGGSTEMLQLLFDYGGSVDLADSRGNSPLHIAASAGNLELIVHLLNKGASATVMNSSGMTPLDIARDRADYEAVEVLKRYN